MKRVPKFQDAPCSRCGTPLAVLNAAWLRQVRLSAKVSLCAFAEAAGVSSAYICDIEHGRRHCLPEMRARYEALAVLPVSSAARQEDGR